MRRVVSWVEISVGLALVAASASLLIYDWFAALYCMADTFECASWAALILGFFLGGPTLLVGVVTHFVPKSFWYGQSVQILLICFVCLIAALP